ncbi:MAG: hypothetical protein M3120_11085 [Pseudomonadota bacterium]|nr:hypothetical protein [Pseudomonadota bacterium]
MPISTTNVTLEDGVTPANLARLAFDDADNLWATEGLNDQLIKFDTADLTGGGTAAPARTIKDFRTFGEISRVLISFYPPPEDLPIAQ